MYFRCNVTPLPFKRESIFKRGYISETIPKYAILYSKIAFRCPEILFREVSVGAEMKMTSLLDYIKIYRYCFVAPFFSSNQTRSLRNLDHIYIVPFERFYTLLEFLI